MGSGSSLFKENSPKFMDAKTLREANQQISIANNYSFGITTRKIALIACSESLPYCDSLIDFLFKFHLSQRTLHYYLLQQMRFIIQITKILDAEIEIDYGFDDSFETFSHSNSNSNSSFTISNDFSLNVIYRKITEDATITKEVAKAINTLWKDRAIVKTFELIIQEQYKHKLKQPSNLSPKIGDKIKEYAIDVPFCEYFFSHIFDYAVESEPSYSQLNKSNVVFNHKHWIDCKLLKRHVLNQVKRNNNNKKVPLCHGTHYSFVFFRVPSTDCEIVIFNVDNPLFNRLELNWYKRVLLLFHDIIYCLPLSWFQLQAYQLHQFTTYLLDQRYNAMYKRLKNLIDFHNATVDYDYKRLKHHTKQESIKQKIQTKLKGKYGYGITIPPIYTSVTIESPPKRSFWLICDIPKVISNARQILRFFWKECTESNPYLLVSKQEREFVSNLLQWQQVFTKRRNDDKQGKLYSDVTAKELNEANVHYPNDVLNYAELSDYDWNQIKKVTFLKSLHYLNVLEKHNEHAYRLNTTINRELVELVESRDESKLNKEYNEYIKEYSRLYDSRHGLNSKWKRRIQGLYLHLPILQSRYDSLMYDFRLEYYRLYLNYPPLYNTSETAFLLDIGTFNNNNRYHRQNGHNNNGFIENLQFRQHFDNTHLYFQNLGLHLEEGRQRLLEKENIGVSQYAIEWFQFATMSICANFKGQYYRPFNFNYDNDQDNKQDEQEEKEWPHSGVVVEECADYVYKWRLDQLIKHKHSFMELQSELQQHNKKKQKNKKKKKKKEWKKSDQMVGGLYDDNEEFEYENYIRLAFSDWNISRLAPISKVVHTGSRITCVVNEKDKKKLTLRSIDEML